MFSHSIYLYIQTLDQFVSLCGQWGIIFWFIQGTWTSWKVQQSCQLIIVSYCIFSQPIDYREKVMCGLYYGPYWCHYNSIQRCLLWGRPVSKYQRGEWYWLISITINSTQVWMYQKTNCSYFFYTYSTAITYSML